MDHLPHHYRWYFCYFELFSVNWSCGGSRTRCAFYIKKSTSKQDEIFKFTSNWWSKSHWTINIFPKRWYGFVGMNALCNLYHPFSTGELVVLDMQYSNIKELCNEIKVRHVNGKAVCSDKNNTCIVRECQKQNEIQDREGIRTIWPNLLDDCSNLANTFKKTLVQVTSLSLSACTHAD